MRRRLVKVLPSSYLDVGQQLLLSPPNVLQPWRSSAVRSLGTTKKEGKVTKNASTLPKINTIRTTRYHRRGKKPVSEMTD